MLYVLLFVLFLFAAAAIFFTANRPQLTVIEGVIPGDFPADRFSHAMFETLLHSYVDSNGDVDYERWHKNEDDLRQLNSYLAAVAAYSPVNTPSRFPKRSDQLAYWLYAYNAYVVRVVLSH